MAGNYADVPGPRIQHDIDGSTVVFISAGTPSNQAVGVNQNLNSDGSTNYELAPGANYWFCVIFPELRDLSGVYLRNSGTHLYFANGSFEVQWSANTTTGVDGTWTSAGTFSGATQGSIAATYRTAIMALSITGAKAIRVGTTSGNGGSTSLQMTNFHIYGQANSASGDRLELWHPTLNQRLGGAALDWGNAARGTTADVQFRVKNCSATKTANGVALAFDALSDASPSNLTQHSVDYNGGGFGSTASIGALSAGTISQVVTVRRTLSSSAALGVWELRIKATATSFT